MSQSRAKEREEVFCLLFSAEFSPEMDAAQLLSLRAESLEDDSGKSPYIVHTFSGALTHADESIALEEDAAKGWKASRMSPTMRALLKLSIYEMLYSAEIPVKIAINEAVELCKAYEDEKGAKFLNGILGTIARENVPMEKRDK